VVNDTVSVVPIIFVSFPPHEFSSCPQCTRSQVMPAVRVRVSVRGRPGSRRVSTVVYVC